MIPGALIGGKYRLLRRLGRGSMGEVWAAVNEATEREVALKLITSPDPELRRRLKREGRAIGRLEHPHIVQILDLGEMASGEPFLVMQRLMGETLADRLRRERALPQDVAASIALDVARALRAAHDKQIVHRDLKPANIFLHREPDTDDDVVKVVDFGVSKLVVEHEGGGTVSGGIIGSPAYMSPEQIRGVGVDGRADVWAVGVMLFEMLAGRRPFPGEQPVVVLGQILSQVVPRVETAAPHVEPALGDVVADCLERDLARRVESAAELAKRLRPFARARFGTIEGARERLTSFTQLSPQGEGGAEAPPQEEREGDLPTAVFKPAALLAPIPAAAKHQGVVVPAPIPAGAGTVRMAPFPAKPAPAPPPAAPPAGDGDGEATFVFRPTAAMREAAADADAAPAAQDEPSADESVRTTNEIEQTLPRIASATLTPSGAWPIAEAAAPPPSSVEPAAVEDEDSEPDAPTAQMTAQEREQYMATRRRKAALMRGVTMPISSDFLPPNPAAGALGWPGQPRADPGPLPPPVEGAAPYVAPSVTTTAPLAGPPLVPPEAPLVLPPGLAPAPRWHTALLVFSAVALVLAVVMLAVTLGGDGATARAPAAGSPLPEAASASASAKTSGR